MTWKRSNTGNIRPMISRKETVAAGGSKIITMPGARFYSVFATPGSGATANVYYTGVPVDELTTTTDWREWPESEVTAAADKVIDGPVTGLKLTSTDGSTVFNLVAV